MRRARDVVRRECRCHSRTNMPTLRGIESLICGAFLAAACVGLATGDLVAAEPPVAVGSRLELMIDDQLVESLTGDLRRVLHQPIMREVVLVHDAPWEGSGSGYHSVFRDGDRYRMYYRGLQYTVTDGKVVEDHPPVTCYAESRDGLHWEKPKLGLFEFGGSNDNNIVWANGYAAHAFAPFKDARPDVPEDERYKALSEITDGGGLAAFASPDGLRWRLLTPEPVIPKQRADQSSLNLAFWDTARGEYRAYWRDARDGHRDIRTATSPDFQTWSQGQWLDYPGSPPREEFYTNGIQPYYRAPQLLIGLPMRYKERGWSAAMRALPDAEHRDRRAAVQRRYGTAITDTLLMSSRDGRTFHRWNEAFIRPGPERPGSWNYGHLGTASGIVETAAAVAGMPHELSVYAVEGHWTGTEDQLRRYSLRIDGFASIHAGVPGGELRTKPLTFAGKELVLNLATSAAGSVAVAIHDLDNKPIAGFGLNDCEAVFGDTLERVVHWTGGDLSRLAGRPVRLRFVMKDADLYALRFR